MKITEGVLRIITNTVNHAIEENDMADIEYILSGKPFPDTDKDEIEFYTFISIHHLFVYNGTDNDDALKYLIFDYSISKANSIDRLHDLKIDTNEHVMKMFEARDTKERLCIELEEKFTSESQSNNKKPKV